MTTITARSITETTKKGSLTAGARRAIVELIQINAYRKERGQPLMMPRAEQWQAPRQLTGLIGLADVDQDAGVSRVKMAHPRKRNVAATIPGHDNKIAENFFDYKGSYKGWRGSDLYYVMQSVGYISQDKKILGVIVDGRKTAVRAGMGYHWAADELGIKLVQTRSGTEYHPDSWEVFEGFAVIRSALLDAKEKRQPSNPQKIARMLRRLASSKKIITMADSLAAGNCKVGTEAFCRLIGIDHRQPVAPAQLLISYATNMHKISDYYLSRLSATLIRLL